MKIKNLFFTLSFFIGLNVTAQTSSTYAVPNLDLVVSVLNNSGVDITGVASAIDHVTGAVYCVGYSNTVSSGRDLVLVKLDSNLVQQWIVFYDFNSGHDRGNALYVDASGNVYVTGESQQSAFTNADAVTLKYDASGNLVWSARLNGTSNTDDCGKSIGVDGSGNVYITGYTGTTGKGKDFLIAKYNSSGTFQSAIKRNGTANADESGEKLVISGSYLYATGCINNTTTNQDVLTMCINISTSTPSWSVAVNGSANGNDTGYDIKLDGTEVFVCGKVNNTTTTDDYYFARMSQSTGAIKYSDTYDGGHNGSDLASALVPDKLGHYAVTGLVANGSNTEVHTRLHDTSSVLWSHVQPINGSYTNGFPKVATDTIAKHFYVSFTYSNTTLNGMLYQLTPSGTKSWTQYHEGAGTARDIHADLVLDGFGRIYLCSANETGVGTGVFDYVMMRYSQTPVYFPMSVDSELVSPALSYIENRGQLIDTGGTVVTDVRFYNTMSKPAFFYKTDNNVFFQFFHRHTDNSLDSIYRINLSFPEKNPYASAHPFEEVGHHYNFLLPHCDTSTTTGVPGYQRLFIPNFQQGIDMHYHFNEMDMKQFFVVKPSFSPSSIVWSFSGATSSTITADGGLEVKCPMGTLRYDTLVAYQAVPTGPTSYTLIPIGVAWDNLSGDDYTFSVTSYTPAWPLVIEARIATNIFEPTHNGWPDWQQLFASSSGGDEEGMAVCTDTDGNSYYTGWANPGIMPLVPSTGLTSSTSNGDEDIWVSKFGTAVGSSSSPGNMDADQLKWTSIIGGANKDKPYGITAYGNGTFAGKVYLTGQTFSSNLPLNPLSGSYNQTTNHGSGDAFIISLDNQFGGQGSSFRAISYFGGSGMDIGRGIKVSNSTGDVFMVGTTGSNAYSTDMCIGSTDGGFPNCTTSVGGIHLAYEGGNTDGFIAKFNSNLVLQQTSFVGGDGDDQLLTVDVNSSKVYTGGFTDNATNLPLPASALTNAYNQSAIAGGTDGYILELSLALATSWGTLYGGDQDDEIRSLAIKTNSIVIGGYTETSTASDLPSLCTVPSNSGFPMCNLTGAFFQGNSSTGAGAYAGGTSDGFLSAFNENNALYWSTYFGAWKADEINGVSIGNQTGSLYIGGTLTEVDQFNDFPGYQNTMDNTTVGGNNAYYVDQTAAKTGFAGWFDNGFARKYSTLSSKDLTQTAHGMASWEQGFDKFYFMTGKTNTVSVNKAFSYGAGNSGMAAMNSCCPNAYNAGFTYYGGANDAYVLRWNVGNMYMPIGINEITLKDNNSITTFPNPFTEGISFKSEKDLTKAVLELYDIQGRLVFSKKLGNFNHNDVEIINLENISQGMYLLRVTSTETNSSFKLIKQ